MRFDISNSEDFYKALNEAKDGDTIRGGRAEIKENLIIARKIKFSAVDFVYHGVQHILAFNSCEFDHCLFLGDVGFTKKLFIADQIKYATFHECEFEYGSVMGLALYNCGECIISGSIFTGNNETTYGYGIWQGGSGKAKGQQLTVSMCYFENLRHAIDGHYNPNHKTIIGCTFNAGVKASISQHSGEDANGQDIPGIGGGNTKIIGCRFNDPDSFGVSSMPPQSGHTLQILDNTFVRPYGKCMEFELPDRIKYRENQIVHQQIILEGNTYGAS